MSSSAPPPSAAATATRDAIARHARALFEEAGYAATSVRAIAAAAGIDPALVIRHYGSKEELFVEVMGLGDQSGPELDEPLDTLGHRLADYVLSPERNHLRLVYSALLRASDYAAVREHLRRTTRTLFVDRLAARLPGPDATLRAELISAQLGGLVQAWSVVGDQWLADVDRNRVVAHYGRAIQALVDPH